MVEPMTNLKGRRHTAIMLTGFMVAAMFYFNFIGTIARLPLELLSGLLLFLIVVFLAAFNSRKKLPFLPLLKASTWLQLHIYVGLIGVFLYCIHTGFGWPDGTLECLLAIVFTVVCLSGFFGIFISRWLPRRMQSSGQALNYEEIPTLRSKLTKRTEKLINEAAKEANSTLLPDFYIRKLCPYLNSRPGLFDPLYLRKTLQDWRRETQAIERYLNDTELPYHKQLLDCLEQKQHLDFVESANRLLRLWLFIHIPFSCSLLILGLVHGVLAIAFISSG